MSQTIDQANRSKAIDMARPQAFSARLSAAERFYSFCSSQRCLMNDFWMPATKSLRASVASEQQRGEVAV